MKRKLSALLSLVLAVVMVFPMGIGVAADDPVEPVIHFATVTDGVTNTSNNIVWNNPAGTNDVEVKKDGTITIAFNATAEEITCDPVGNHLAIAKIEKTSDDTFTITGKDTTQTPIDITFTFKNGTGDGAKTTTRKIKVSCVSYTVTPPTISNFYEDGVKKTLSNNTKVSVVEGASKTISFTGLDSTTVTCNITGNNHDVASCVDNGDGSFTFTGKNQSAQETSVVFTFIKTENGIQSAPVEKTIKMSCAAATVVSDATTLLVEEFEVRYKGSRQSPTSQVTVSSTDPNPGKAAEFNDGDLINAIEIRVKLSNGFWSDWCDAEVYLAKDGLGSMKPNDNRINYNPSTTMYAGYNYIYFKTSVTSDRWFDVAEVVTAYASLHVTTYGEDYSSLEVVPTSKRTGTNATPFKKSEIAVIDEDFSVYGIIANSNKRTLLPYDTLDYCYLIHTKSAALAEQHAAELFATSGKTATSTYIPKSFNDYDTNENIYIVAGYKGRVVSQAIYKEGSMTSNFYAFSDAKPETIEISAIDTVTVAATNKYYEGQKFGYGEYGFSGVTIKVTYDDKVDGNKKYLEFKDENGIAELMRRGTLNVTTFGDDASNKNKFTISYTENGKTVRADYTAGSGTLAGISVSKDSVVDLEIVNKSSVSTTFTEGNALTFPGLKLKLVYASGRTNTDTIDYDSSSIIMTPAKNSILGTTDKLVTFKYKLSTDTTDNTYAVAELPIKVNAKPVEPEPDPVITVTKVLLTEYYNTTKDYYIGEEFKFTGYAITIVKSDGSTVERDLSDCYNKKVNTRYYDNSDDEFTTEMKGSLAVEFTLKSGSVNDSTNPLYTVYIPDIVVTKRPTLETITVSSSKSTYMEGESPRVCDFKIVASYDNKDTRVFEVAENVDGAKKTSYDVTESGIKRKVSITPTSVNADTKSLRITYSETLNGKTTSATYDYEITVTVPDVIMRYYDKDEKGYLTKPVEDFYDALEEAEKLMDSYSSAYSNRIPSLQLRRDVTMLSDFTTTESIDIDLNGHSITMIRGDISISSRAASDTEVSITNTDRTEGKLIYSTNDEDSVLIAYNDTYVIDADSTGDGKYDITITDTKNGKVSGPDEVTHGHDAQFTITPDEGYEIGSIKVNNKTVSIPKEGEKLTISDIQQKQTVTVTFKEKAWDCPFTDVYKSASYYKAIQFVYENELFQGTSATKFEPDTTMTRAMFVTVLGRLANVNVNNYSTMSFTDVKNSAATSWYVPYVEWAASIGLVEGYGNGKFGPDDPITHAQMYVLMQRYALLVEKLSTNATGTSIPANDVKDIPEWAVDAVRYAAKKDFLVLSSNRLTPNANAKRAELAVLLNDFCENVLGWDD